SNWPQRRWNRSTRPRCTRCWRPPVKNGWHLEQTSTRSSFWVEWVVNVSPHEHVTVASNHSGWMPAFIAISPRSSHGQTFEPVFYHIGRLDTMRCHGGKNPRDGRESHRRRGEPWEQPKGRCPRTR